MSEPNAVAREPRGCPTPGACSCLDPAPPAEVAAALREWAHRQDLLKFDSGEHVRPGSPSWADLLATVTALVAAAVRQERELCAEVAGRFAENYPTAVFSPADARELAIIADDKRLRLLSDRLGADMARRTSVNIARVLRDTIRQEPRP